MTTEHMSLDNDHLPPGWLWTTMEECVDILDRHRIPVNAKERARRTADKSPDELYPYYGATQQVGWIDDYLFDEELLLLGEDGVPFLDPSRPKAYIIRGKSWVNNHAHVLRAIQGLTSNAYLCHYLNTFDYQGYVTGTTRLKLNQTRMKSIPVLLPPLLEQRRIVAKIEALFAQSRAAREALEAVPDLVAKFRQAVLAAAFRGELVEQAPEDDPASILLERIRAERRHKWEEDLRAQGKDPGRRTYQKPAPPDTSDLPELPEGWVWTSLDTLTEVRGGVTKGRDLSRFDTIEVPYLRVANVQSGYLDLDEVKTIQIKASELEKYRLRPKDILFTEGGDRDKLGRGTVWQGEVEVCVHQNHVFAARSYGQEVIPEWVSLASQTTYARDYFWAVARQTVNLASINMTKLKAFLVPIPPQQEQRRIVARIEALFAQADALEAAATVAHHRLEQADQAVLARAFRGELVEQASEHV